MCQSKSEGGARCEAFAKKAMNDHQIIYSNLVQQECVANGIMIDPACYELTSEEDARVSLQVRADPTVQKAHAEARKAAENLRKVHGMLTDALGSGDINRFATLIRQHDPELKSINDDAEARRITFNTNMAKAPTEKAKDELILKNRMDIALLNDRKVKLNAFSKQQAIDSFSIYRGTNNSKKALLSLVCLQKTNAETIAAQDRATSKISGVHNQMDKVALMNKVKCDPGFQEAESLPAFRNSPVFQKWDAKNKELVNNYRMTSGYQNNLAAKISADKQAGEDTTGMEKAYKALTVQKAKSEYENIVEFHGESSAQAAAALGNFNDAKQKEHSF